MKRKTSEDEKSNRSRVSPLTKTKAGDAPPPSLSPSPLERSSSLLSATRWSKAREGAREREREKKKRESAPPPPPSTQAQNARVQSTKMATKCHDGRKKRAQINFVDEERTLFFHIFVKSFIHSFKAHPVVKLFLINISFWNPPNPPLFFFDWTTTIFTFLQKTLKKESGQKVSSNRIFFDVGFRVFKSLLSSRIIFRRRRGRIIILLFINSSFFFHRAVKHYY